MTEHLLGVLKRLPPPILQAVVRGEQTWGEICEVRIRAGRRLALTTVEGGFNRLTSLYTDPDMVREAVTALCDHSLHAHMDSIREGYIALPGGVRVGVAGKAVCDGGTVCNISDITSLCIRIPAPTRRVDDTVFRALRRGGFRESYLFFSPPGVGKTTLLRDLALSLSEDAGLRVALIDSRCELANDALSVADHIDVYSGYPKGKAIELATRTMNPQYIVCDEIGTLEEALALLAVENAGVPLLASAHAGGLDQLLRRQNIRMLHRAEVFDRYVGLSRTADRLSFRFYGRETLDP
ncbi:MAG: hypothetical protein ACI3YH_09180 [Eubacteriales bacterium]